jgi:hypothetical protein
MPIYNKINAGFALGATEPVTSGIEDVIYIFNDTDDISYLRYHEPINCNRLHGC